jgi:uncharacterized membrane protein YfcA
MEKLSVDVLLFLVSAGFISAFVDSVVGGGGLISLPALLMVGINPAIALGTNKMASVMGSCTSTLSFLRSGKIDIKLVKYLFPLSFLGSVAGVFAVQLIPSQFLKPLVVVMLLVVTVYTFTKKDWGNTSTYRGASRKIFILSSLCAFAFGFYDGFFGPGVGSFLIFSFLLVGFDFVVAAGNAKALNFASNIAAVITFAYFGSINYLYAIPMGLSMIAGAMAGSSLAIRRGTAYVKTLFLFVSVLLIGKQVWDVFRH